MEEFKLTEYEAHQSSWAKIKTHLNDQLRIFREQNDNDLDEIKTAKIRGKISLIKELLAADKTDINQPTA